MLKKRNESNCSVIFRVENTDDSIIKWNDGIGVYEDINSLINKFSNSNKYKEFEKKIKEKIYHYSNEVSKKLNTYLEEIKFTNEVDTDVIDAVKMIKNPENYKFSFKKVKGSLTLIVFITWIIKEGAKKNIIELANCILGSIFRAAIIKSNLDNVLVDENRFEEEVDRLKNNCRVCRYIIELIEQRKIIGINLQFVNEINAKISLPARKICEKFFN